MTSRTLVGSFEGVIDVLCSFIALNSMFLCPSGVFFRVVRVFVCSITNSHHPCSNGKEAACAGFVVPFIECPLISCLVLWHPACLSTGQVLQWWATTQTTCTDSVRVGHIGFRNDNDRSVISDKKKKYQESTQIMLTIPSPQRLPVKHRFTILCFTTIFLFGLLSLRSHHWSYIRATSLTKTLIGYQLLIRCCTRSDVILTLFFHNQVMRFTRFL